MKVPEVDYFLIDDLIKVSEFLKKEMLHDFKIQVKENGRELRFYSDCYILTISACQGLLGQRSNPSPTITTTIKIHDTAKETIEVRHITKNL